ncbi:MAG: hypothetical protein AAF928_16410 [Myxococcota bacterium]
MKTRGVSVRWARVGASAMVAAGGMLTGVVGCGGDDDEARPSTGRAMSVATSGTGGVGASSGGGAETGGGGGGVGDSDAGGAGGGRPAHHSSGCVDGTGRAEGVHTFDLDGRSRRYVLRLPQDHGRLARAWPVVLALHGNGGDVGYWDVTSGPRNIREVVRDDAVLVIAEAIDNRWRDYGADPATWPARIEDELAYFDEVIRHLETDLCIDRHAIFSMGFSGGGSFSGVLGCRRPNIRAIAAGGSVVYFDPAACVHAPAAWIAISDGDESAGRFAFRDHFRDAAGCSTTSMPSAPSACTRYDGCDEGTPVDYCDHPGGHQWPDFGAQAAWDFFAPFVTEP